MSGTIYRDEDWEHGMICGACDHVFVDGNEIYGRAEAMTEGGVPIEVAICDLCASTMKPLKA